MSLSSRTDADEGLVLRVDQASPSFRPLCPALEIRNVLSETRTGVVYLGACNGVEIVIKRYIKSHLTDLAKHQVDREVRLHGSLYHPNLVSLWGAWEDDISFSLILEPCLEGEPGPSSLFCPRHPSRPPSVPMQATCSASCPPTACWTRSIWSRWCCTRCCGCSGTFTTWGLCTGTSRQGPPLLLLRTRRPLLTGARHMQPENILMCEDGRSVKLADFGLSIAAGAERPVTRLGTLEYM